MKTNNITLNEVRDTDMTIEELRNTLIWKENQEAARLLKSVGFDVKMESEVAGKFRYILVYCPDESVPAEWATSGEARRLHDIAVNLPPMEAWKRWMQKLEPFREYTESEIDRMERETDARLRRLSATELGRFGGMVRSERKAATSAENGKKGGRPRKNPAE